MSHTDLERRPLRLTAALAAGIGGLPRLVRGAVGAILLCELVWLLPLGWKPEGWGTVLWGLAAGLSMLVALGALARLSIHQGAGRPEGLGPLGLQLGRPELRLLGAWLLCLLFLTMILTIVVLVVLAIFGMAELDVQAIQGRNWASVGAPWKLGVLAVVGLGALAIPLLLAVRLSLFAPATLGRRQMVSLTSVALTRGRTWPLLGGLVVTSAPAILLALGGASGLLSPLAVYGAAVIVLIGVQAPLTMAFLGAVYLQVEDWAPERSQ